MNNGLSNIAKNGERKKSNYQGNKFYLFYKNSPYKNKLFFDFSIILEKDFEKIVDRCTVLMPLFYNWTTCY
jgi:hypothetical protein